MSCITETYVAMATYNDTHNPAMLGCSPAELDYCVEDERPLTFANHDGCPELRLWEGA